MLALAALAASAPAADGNGVDACGIPGGNGALCTDAYDCAPGSGQRIGPCGTCGDDGSGCTSPGCNVGQRRDACGVCGGDNACLGDGMGPAATPPPCPGPVDACGVCFGENACLDCSGRVNGTSVPDSCGTCDGVGRDANGRCPSDPGYGRIGANLAGRIYVRALFSLGSGAEAADKIAARFHLDGQLVEVAHERAVEGANRRPWVDAGILLPSRDRSVPPRRLAEQLAFYPLLARAAPQGATSVPMPLAKPGSVVVVSYADVDLDGGDAVGVGVTAGICSFAAVAGAGVAHVLMARAVARRTAGAADGS